MHLRSEITIAASAERVWQVLTDFAAYREWNPFMLEASGRPAKGERLTIRMQPVDGRAMTFTPTVLEAAPGHRLRWLGRPSRHDRRVRASQAPAERKRPGLV